MAVSKSLCDKISLPDGLTSLVIRSDERKKSWEQAHLANALNGRYLTCGDGRKSQSPHRSHLAILKSGVSRLKRGQCKGNMNPTLSLSVPVCLKKKGEFAYMYLFYLKLTSFANKSNDHCSTSFHR